jgi:hypothetical protein
MRRLYLVTIIVGGLVLAITIGGVLWWMRDGGMSEDQMSNEDQSGDSLTSGLRPAEERESGEAYPDPQADNDEDGLSNNDEAIWGSDPDNRDTDGDGYLDGEEVAAGHDPTIPAPNDKLPEETLTDRTTYKTEEDQAVEMKQVQPSAADKYDSFFVDRDELYEEEGNLTDEYNKEYSGSQQTTETLSEFVEGLGVTTSLPKPGEKELPATQESSSAAISAYLRVADNKNALANNQVYAQAMSALYERNDVSGIQNMALLVSLYRSDLMSVSVPEAAMAVHKLLLAYTDALIVTFEEVVMWNEDPAKSLRGTKQLSALDRQYYPIIFREFEKLRDLEDQI